jgi:hypothetical protein
MFNDTCYYLEAVAGDGGNHTAAAWWLSPDIILNGGSDQATATAPNNIDIRGHLGPCEAIASESLIAVDVYVGDPSLVMTPGGNTTKITNAPGRPVVMIPQLSSIGSTLVSFPWVLGGTSVEAPGHKCLIAQFYVTDESPSASTFDLPQERHVAQRNITILAGKASGEVTVNTINPNRKAPALVTVRAIADTKPVKHVLQAARGALNGVPDFKRLRTTNVPRFQLSFRGFPNARIRNHTGKRSAQGNFGRLKVPNCEARFEMKPGQRAKFKFQVDLEKAEYGDAFIFHLMHIDAKRRVIGGLTVIAVRTKREPRSDYG